MHPFTFARLGNVCITRVVFNLRAPFARGLLAYLIFFGCSLPYWDQRDQNREY